MASQVAPELTQRIAALEEENARLTAENEGCRNGHFGWVIIAIVLIGCAVGGGYGLGMQCYSASQQSRAMTPATTKPFTLEKPMKESPLYRLTDAELKAQGFDGEHLMLTTTKDRPVHAVYTPADESGTDTRDIDYMDVSPPEDQVVFLLSDDAIEIGCIAVQILLQMQAHYDNSGFCMDYGRVEYIRSQYSAKEYTFNHAQWVELVSWARKCQAKVKRKLVEAQKPRKPRKPKVKPVRPRPTLKAKIVQLNRDYHSQCEDVKKRITEPEPLRTVLEEMEMQHKEAIQRVYQQHFAETGEDHERP